MELMILQAACRRAAIFLLSAVLVVLFAPAWAQKGYGMPKFLAYLADRSITESSGIEAGRRTPGVLWTHNDSANGPYLYAADRKGRALARFHVEGASSVDWEDISIGPGIDNTPALYIGDIGDNAQIRKDTAVYRVEEPAVNLKATNKNGKTKVAERFPFVYPDGSHDAETLMVHPVTGEIFIVTKLDSGVSGVYRLPMPLTRDRVVTLEKVATVKFTNPLVYRGRAVGKLATGGDISPDGKRIVIRTYTDVFEWDIKQGRSVTSSLKGKPRRIIAPFLGQYESICYSADGKSLFTTSEGSPCPLWEMPGR